MLLASLTTTCQCRKVPRGRCTFYSPNSYSKQNLTDSVNSRVPTDTKKFRVLSPLLKSHSSSLLHLLPTLTDSATQKLILNSTIPLIPYFLPLRKFLRSFVKAAADVWSSSSAEESARITAFLVIRKIVVVGDEGLKQMSFKALYAGLIQSSRQTSRHTMDGINLMKNSAGEILGLEGMHKVGYSVAFGYIRQLAIHLRESINNNSKVPPPPSPSHLWVATQTETFGKTGIIQNCLQLAIRAFPRLLVKGIIDTLRRVHRSQSGQSISAETFNIPTHSGNPRRHQAHPHRTILPPTVLPHPLAPASFPFNRRLHPPCAPPLRSSLLRQFQKETESVYPPPARLCPEYSRATVVPAHPDIPRRRIRAGDRTALRVLRSLL